MKSLSTKLILSALGVALLATPAFAAKHHQASYQGLQNSAAGAPAPTTDVGTYPNGATRSGSALFARIRRRRQRDPLIPFSMN